MNAKTLKIIVADLKELRLNLYLAERTKDKRSREKIIREAKLAISSYAHYLPDEVKIYLEENVAVNALNYKWVTSDIKMCIESLEKWICSIQEE